MPSTPNINLTYLQEGQNSAEITVNEAFNRLDAMVNAGIINRTTTVPPISPAQGDLYIPKATATGAWVGHENDLAMYYQGWLFATPEEGWTVYDKLDDVILSWNGTAWITMGRSARQIGIHVEAPTATFETMLLYTDRALTITKLRGVIQGTTNVVWKLYFAATRNAAGTEITTSGGFTVSTLDGDTTQTPTGTVAVPANSWIWVDVDSVVGSPDWAELLVDFTLD